MHAARNLLWPLLGAALVAGCATGEDRWTVDGVPDGTRLTVHESIPVSSYSGRAHVQRGESVSPGRINRFEPSCGIRLGGSDERPHRIEPGSFEVGGYRTRRSYGGSRSSFPQPRLMAGMMERDPITHIRYETRVTLFSPEQPAVSEMICAYETATRSRHLRFNEIRAVLDGLATLERPDGG